jgi:cysteine synthase A
VNILDAIGGTPLVRLRNIVQPGSARVFLKVEGGNPTGSMKDRMALAAVEAAERDGRLRPGGILVEYTGGSTGPSLALVCQAKGYRCHLVSSDAFSAEKIAHMRALNATVTVIPSERGLATPELFAAMIAEARAIATRPGGYLSDQLDNRDMAEGYRSMGHEIWEELDGQIDVFVQSVGTSHSLRGVSQAFRERQGAVRVVAVEPAESSVLSGGRPGGHRIEGIGVGFIPPLWRSEFADDVRRVSSAAAFDMARRLAREEGVFAGASTGANVTAALEVARELPSGKTVVTIAVDTGLKYLSTDLFTGQPAAENDC